MSLFRNIRVACSECNTEGDYTVWDSVNVDLNPELREKVMTGSIFSWICPNCGKKHEVPYTFIYNDMTHKFLIQFVAGLYDIMRFAACIRIMEYGLDETVVGYLYSLYSESHPENYVLFEEMTSDRQLCFTVCESVNEKLEPTDKKHYVAYEDYISTIPIVYQLLEDIKQDFKQRGILV